jgi:hypothetical protein
MNRIYKAIKGRLKELSDSRDVWDAGKCGNLFLLPGDASGGMPGQGCFF